MAATTEIEATGRVRLSYRDYAELPDDGKRYEILDGELAVTPAPTTRHQKISRRLHFLLYTELELQGRGEVYNAPVDVVFDDHTVAQPDLAFIAATRSAIIEEKFIRGAPDLVVEILSPSTRRRDVLVKAALYARFGVTRYWIVDPAIDRIDMLVLRDGVYATEARVDAPAVARPEAFDGLAIPLADVFAD